MEIKLTKVLFSNRKGVFKLIMRTFIFLLCTTVFSFNTEIGFSQEQVKIDTDRTVSIDEVFIMIQQQTKYRFLYPQDLFKDLPKVQLKKGKIKADELINQSISNGKFNVVLTADNTIIIKEAKTAQQIQVSGKVTDEKGMPVAGATVLIKGTARGVASDFDGSYSITVSNPENVLVFSALGFATQEITVGNQAVINVTLKEKTDVLDEVLVVGYGTTKKRDLTGSVGSVDSEDIQQIKTQTIDQALVGKISGVHISALSGQPGAGAIVHIRGLSALRGDNQPLYVVDGVPIIINPIFEANGVGIFGSRENPLLAINPNDVERVDVLKDASAAAIYGSRAANGVIIITTKRGTRNQKPRFNFSLNSTFQNPIKKWDALNAEQYKAFVTEGAQARITAGTGTPTDNTIVNNPNDFFGNEDTDWQEEITNKNALWNDYRFSLTGGSQNINYLVSAGVTDQEGIMIGSKLNRYNFATNLDADVTEKIRTGASINYNYTVNKTSGVTGLQQGLFRPDVGVFDDAGQYTTVPAFGGALGPNILSRNPVGGAGLARNKRIGQNLFGSVYGEYKIIENLRFKSQISIAVNNDRTSNFSPSFSDAAVFNLYFGNAAEATLSNQRNDSYATVFTNTLSYNAEFEGGHKLDAVAGISWDQSRTDIETQTYAGFPDDFILTNVRSANRVSSYGGESIQAGLNSVFGRFNYQYKDRYLATFTARGDTSTKFGSNNQTGFFPSGALAWNVHNETFFNSELIDQLKLRASLGRTGSDNLASFSYLAYMSSLANNASVYADVNGIAVTGLPNPDIKWESTDQLDLGLEFAMFDNRLFGEIIYFEKNTSDIILFTPIPSETGFAAYNANVADVSNKGWEFNIGGDIIRKDNLTWNSSFNISFVENNVESLNGGSVFSTGSSPNILEGQPIGVISGYDVIGIAQTQAEIDALNAGAPDGSYHSSLTRPGNYILRDINGDGEITTADRTPLGDINPNYFGGWNNTLTHKNFEFTFNFQFVQGNEKELVNSLAPQLSNTNPYANTTTIIYDTWSPDNPNAKYGILGTPTSEGTSWFSTFVQDGSYLRLRTLSLGYNFPQTLMDKFGLNTAKLSFTANNVFTITDYDGLDPESVSRPRGGATTDLTRDEGYAYPLARTFTFGLNVSF